MTRLQFSRKEYQTDGTNIKKLNGDGSSTIRLNDGGGNSLSNVYNVNDLTAGANILSVGDFAYNGSSWDKLRNNVEGSLLASQARTAAATGPTMKNYNGKGVVIWLNVTAVSGTGGITPYLYGVDPVSGGAYYFAQGGTITATGLYPLVFYPGASGGHQYYLAALPLPKTWFVYVGVADASSYTYSIGYSLIN